MLVHGDIQAHPSPPPPPPQPPVNHFSIHQKTEHQEQQARFSATTKMAASAFTTSEGHLNGSSIWKAAFGDSSTDKAFKGLEIAGKLRDTAHVKDFLASGSRYAKR